MFWSSCNLQYFADFFGASCCPLCSGAPAVDSTSPISRREFFSLPILSLSFPSPVSASATVLSESMYVHVRVYVCVIASVRVCARASAGNASLASQVRYELTLPLSIATGARTPVAWMTSPRRRWTCPRTCPALSMTATSSASCSWDLAPLCLGTSIVHGVSGSLCLSLCLCYSCLFVCFSVFSCLSARVCLLYAFKLFVCHITAYLCYIETCQKMPSKNKTNNKRRKRPEVRIFLSSVFVHKVQLIPLS